jgi:hypothetical protein
MTPNSQMIGSPAMKPMINNTIPRTIMVYSSLLLLWLIGG